MNLRLNLVIFRRTLAATSLILASSTFAAAPNLLNYQGRLTTPGGTPVVDNTYAVTFSIFSVPSGGSALWTETQAVTTVGGIFSAILGSTIPFTDGMFADSTRYLGIKVGADPEILPRTRLTSVPFALSSNNGWTDDGSVVRLNSDLDYVGIGTNTPSHPLHLVDKAGGLFPFRVEGSHPVATVSEFANTSSASTWEVGVTGSSGAWFGGVLPGDMYFHKQGNYFPGLILSSNNSMGLGTGTPRARLEVVTSDTAAGLFTASALSGSTEVLRAEYTGIGNYYATAVSGKSTPADGYGFGGYFEGGYTGVVGTVNQNGTGGYIGVNAQALGNGTGSKYGVYGSAIGDDGDKYGVFGSVFGGGSGKLYGVYGSTFWANTNVNRFAVYGYAPGPGPGEAYGGYFDAHKIGVAAYGSGNPVGNCYGLNAWGAHTSGNSSFGVNAYATGNGTNYGVYGEAYGGTTNWAGYFDANVHINGTLSKTAGSFRIDHPLDPENKYLQHSFVESPDMMNIYNGNVVTDGSGNATVALPDYFSALNKDFRYQLTVIGQFAQAIVSSKVSDNQFSIRTDKPGVEVSWQVTGIRKDAYAEANRIQVEVEKNDHEKGKFAHPELFGRDRTMGVGFHPESEKLQLERQKATEGDLTSPSVHKKN